MKIDQQIVFIYVRDLVKSREYYLGLLGCKLLVDQGRCLIVRTSPGGYLGVCQKDGGGSGSENLILTFVTDQVDAWYEKLINAGVQIEGGPKENQEFGIYHFFASDPDGYRLEFQQFQDPDWHQPA